MLLKMCRIMFWLLHVSKLAGWVFSYGRWGATRIAEWSSHLNFEHWYGMVRYATPWGQSLVMTFLFRLKHNIYAQLSEKTEWRKQKKQLLMLLFVKKLLKFVLFMKLCWKSWKWRINLFFKKRAYEMTQLHIQVSVK